MQLKTRRQCVADLMTAVGVLAVGTSVLRGLRPLRAFTRGTRRPAAAVRRRPSRVVHPAPFSVMRHD